MQQRNTLWTSVFFPYVSYVSLFLGMGLISGSLVHMPVDPVRYTLIMLVGVVLFGFASFISDISKQPDLTLGGIIRVLGFSLLLSVGIGMISGGVQHFSDNPEWATLLIPMGLTLSLVSFILKNNVNLSVKRVYAIALILLAVTVPLKVGLDYMAVTTIESGDSHGGGHGGH